MPLRLGKPAPIIDSRTLQFAAYMKPQLPAPPEMVDWGKAVKSWPMYYNDQYGDCTVASAAHMVQNWTAAAGNAKKPADEAVLKFYEHFVTPGPEAGVFILDALKYWRKTGLGGHKVRAFVAVELKNKVQAQDAISLFGSLDIGLALPNFVADAADPLSIPWVVPAHGAVGNAAPNPMKGHCVPAVGYDARGISVVTWGTIKTMSWQFYRAYADEAYAVLSDDFFNDKTHKAASGFDFEALDNDLQVLQQIPSRFASVSHHRP